MPSRIIKESICSSESINELSWFEEVVFYRLIVNCDDYGCFDARPPILKARLFPLKSVTEKQISDALNKLATAGIVRLYEYERKPYLQFTSWAKHQQIRAQKHKFPEPDINCNQLISDDINCNQLLLARAESNPIQSESNPNPNPNTNPVPDVHIHGSSKNVRLTGDEWDRLKQEFPDLADDAVEFLSLWLVDKGDKSKSRTHNATIRRWVLDAVREKHVKLLAGGKSALKKPSNMGNFEERRYSDADMDGFYEDVTKLTKDDLQGVSA